MRTITAANSQVEQTYEFDSGAAQVRDDRVWLSASELVSRYPEYSQDGSMVSTLVRLGYMSRKRSVCEVRCMSKGNLWYTTPREVWVYDESQWVAYWEATAARAAVLANLRESNGYDTSHPGRGN